MHSSPPLSIAALVLAGLGLAAADSFAIAGAGYCANAWGHGYAKLSYAVAVHDDDACKTQCIETAAAIDTPLVGLERTGTGCHCRFQGTVPCPGADVACWNPSSSGNSGHVTSWSPSWPLCGGVKRCWNPNSSGNNHPVTGIRPDNGAGAVCFMNTNFPDPATVAAACPAAAPPVQVTDVGGLSCRIISHGPYVIGERVNADSTFGAVTGFRFGDVTVIFNEDMITGSHTEDMSTAAYWLIHYCNIGQPLATWCNQWVGEGRCTGLQASLDADDAARAAEDEDEVVEGVAAGAPDRGVTPRLRPASADGKAKASRT